MLNLGEMVKKERINLGLSQQKLADEAGVTKRAINYWETGKKNMSVESADKVFKALHMSITIGESQSKI
jgi:transcriptional regulator with XRE-family HTH domain